MGLSRLIIFLINRGYVKFSSGIHIASSKGYPVQVTKNSFIVFLPFCTLRHRNSFSTSYTGSFVGSMSAGCRSTGLLHTDSRQGFRRDTWNTRCMDHLFVGSTRRLLGWFSFWSEMVPQNVAGVFVGNCGTVYIRCWAALVDLLQIPLFFDVGPLV